MKTEQLATFLGVPVEKLEKAYRNFSNLFVEGDYTLTHENEICWTVEGAQSLAALIDQLAVIEGRWYPYLVFLLIEVSKK